MMMATVQMMPEPAVDAGETADAVVRTHAMYMQYVGVNRRMRWCEYNLFYTMLHGSEHSTHVP